MAQWTGKVVGSFLGALALGPLGAALGFAAGHFLDAKTSEPDDDASAPYGLDAQAIGEQFFRSAFHVMGHVAKADGRVSESEIAAARRVMSDLRLDASRVRLAIDYFTAGKQSDFNLGSELKKLRRVCGGRGDILRVFLEIQMRAAIAGNNLDGASRATMKRIAAELDISGLEFAHIETVVRIRSGSFKREQARASVAQIDQAYSVLETAAQATDAEVVKAYRRQLSRHHPDKLKANGLPESMIEHAKQRTQQIIEAYELIRERRGMT